MLINIYQGSSPPPTVAKITIVIDVIRAFTVAHYAFLQGVKRILLVDSVEQALTLKKENPHYLLAGEVRGLPIKGFDLDNSPHHIQEMKLEDKVIVQKTTNGVKATLSCLESEHVFVTGFTNAKTTAEFIREKLVDEKRNTINIIASHPTGDDDLACAEYIRSILEQNNSISHQSIVERIMHSHVAEKFFDDDNIAFSRDDIFHCIRELNTEFVMRVNKTSKIPMIERVNV